MPVIGKDGRIGYYEWESLDETREWLGIPRYQPDKQTMKIAFAAIEKSELDEEETLP